MRLLKMFTVSMAVLLGNSVFASDKCTENCVTKIVTDFSGRPPFKRTIERVSVVDIAQVDIVMSDTELVEVQTVDFSGKPPFKRTTELVEQIDVMQVELTAEPESSDDQHKKGTGNSIFKKH